jgi:hypothetical protein
VKFESKVFSISRFTFIKQGHVSCQFED